MPHMAAVRESMPFERSGRTLHVLPIGSPMLLTGVTGLIGGELLRALIRRGTRDLTAVVRPINGESPISRIADRLCRSGASP